MQLDYPEIIELTLDSPAMIELTLDYPANVGGTNMHLMWGQNHDTRQIVVIRRLFLFGKIAHNMASPSK